MVRVTYHGIDGQPDTIQTLPDSSPETVNDIGDRLMLTGWRLDVEDPTPGYRYAVEIR